MKFYETNWFIILMLVVFFPVGLYLMWSKANWSKVAKIIVTVAIAILGVVAVFTDDYTEKETNNTTQSTQKAHTSKEDNSNTNQDKTEKKAHKPSQNELSSKYKHKAKRYIDKVSKSYRTMGELSEDNLTDGKILNIMHDAQDEFEKAQNTYDVLDPKTDKDKEVQKKIERINALTDRAYMNAEDGFNNRDEQLIESATDDIDESGENMHELQIDLK